MWIMIVRGSVQALVPLVCCLVVACGDGDGDGDGDDGDDGGGSANTCEALCARTINCPNDPAADCVSECQQYEQPCPTQMEMFIQCSLARSDSELICDEFGETALADGFCTTETNSLASCLVAAQ